MRKLTGAVFVSLDGIMQAPGGPEEDPTGGFRFGGWTAPFWSADMGPFEQIIEGEYDLLLGKRTYDIFAAYWPHNRDIPIGEKFQRIGKYVLTHSEEPLAWENSHRLAGETAAAVAELKQTDGQEETDFYWNAIVSNGGQESACGWCKDRWGFSWQITPRALLRANSNPDKAAARRAFEAMMTMRKIDIARIEAAERGVAVDA